MATYQFRSSVEAVRFDPDGTNWVEVCGFCNGEAERMDANTPAHKVVFSNGELEAWRGDWVVRYIADTYAVMTNAEFSKIFEVSA
jgi:hypothetical protein